MENHNLEELSKAELIDIITKLQQSQKFTPDNDDMHLQSPEKKLKKQPAREFDMKKYTQRRISLRIAYFGWNYYGFASQSAKSEEECPTVESALFSALLRTKLIESRELCQYSRSGRTDKGVSAVGQVIALNVRSNLKITTHGNVTGLISESNSNLIDQADSVKEDMEEINYVKTLNNSLPDDIRVTAWAPVPLNFDARFSTKTRTYKYFFVKRTLDIQKMIEAGSRLLGTHDFRNFCKADVVNVESWDRTILEFSIRSCSFPFLSSDNLGSEHQMFEITIKGSAFLWHQVRCIVSVLFLVGQHKEDCEVIDQLLDVEKNPRKPVYEIASEIPLVLWDCAYDPLPSWRYYIDTQELLYNHFSKLWSETLIKSCVLFLPIHTLENSQNPTYHLVAKHKKVETNDENVLQNMAWANVMTRISTKPEKYVKLMNRPKEESIEHKQQNLSTSKRNRIESNKQKQKRHKENAQSTVSNNNNTVDE